ncbi:nucleotide-binding protein [Azospirillum canadense]|uniref:nucleotide-binding protein n=1 Tax=Azospirillum canadense TaxID=403962 RepID=UPI00222658F3|nr:hypothetical protein [Azospirillum canadense]MCW2240898.1 Mrp family chromosome partitioning ATPase [Azospirillum canadense]
MSIIVRATQGLRPTAGRDERRRAPSAGAALDQSPAPEPADAPAVGEPFARESAGSGRRVPSFPLDFTALKRAGVAYPEGLKSRLAEELRLIKRRLFRDVGATAEEASVERPNNTIVVTSARSNEGKTFTSVNLALSIAMGERRKVVLIDGDPIRRSLSTLLGVADRPGLTDALRHEGRRDPLDSLLDCYEQALFVLPAGTAQNSAADIFSGERMASLLIRAASMVGDGLVIIDAPPVLTTSESLALAHQAGRVLMVVAAGRTSRSAIGAALDRLEMDERISLVLNRQPPHLSPADLNY